MKKINDGSSQGGSASNAKERSHSNLIDAVSGKEQQYQRQTSHKNNQGNESVNIHDLLDNSFSSGSLNKIK